MSLTPGTRLGPYEVSAQIGVGGMGEVYRATDTNLARQVAIKVLPESMAADAERLARFDREAKTLAALNHPHIAAIYGLERSDGQTALVMELVEGPTLADRIVEGPIPVDDALAIAKQIADALEAAHEQGIVHRDLKPANIKVRPDGTVKVLDFGLAKATEPTGALSPERSQSPTITTPAMTQLGVILGTAAYMSPEQAKGRPADKRSDIWAFGCVLYEMLTGKRAFEGEDISDTLAAVLRSEPDWTALPSNTPSAITRVIRRCLERDPKRRLHDIADLQILSDEISSLALGQAARAPVTRFKRRATQFAGAVILLFGGAAAAWLVLESRMTSVPRRVERLELTTPRDAPFTVNPTGPNVVMSADGSQVVYHVLAGGSSRLALRRLDRLEQTLIPGTALGFFPFFSPDGTQLAFSSARKLVKVALSSGLVRTVCDLTGDFGGGSWGTDDVIVFAEGRNGLFRVPAAGGKPEKIAGPDTKKDELGYAAPEVLPGGKAVLFTIIPLDGRLSQARLAARTLVTGTTKILVEGATPGHYSSTGHLVFNQGGTLMAVPFDVETLALVGSPTSVLEKIVSKSALPEGGAADFSVGSDGSLIFAPAGTSNVQRLVWIDRGGKRVAALTDQPLQLPRYPRLSPDGHRLAVTVGPGNDGNIWIYNLTGSSQPLRLTFKGHNTGPTWTPDGKYITFSSTVLGSRNLFRLPSDLGSFEPERLTISANIQSSLSWSPSGSDLLYMELDPSTQTDLWLLALTGDRQPRRWLQTEFNEDEASFSPSGRWVAYVTDQTGQSEVWIRPFPGPGPPTRVSPFGGHDPVWSRDGKALFYQNGNKMLALEVTAQETEFRVKASRELFEGGFVPYTRGQPRTYDVASDGRFLMIEPAESAAATLILVRNWSEELKDLPRTK